MEAMPSAFAVGSSGTGALGITPDPAPSSLQIFALVIIFVFPALALVVVLTRVAGRFATHQFGWDDWLICVAMLFSVAETVFSFFFIKTNFVGIHIDQVPMDRDPTEALIWTYAVQILYNPILALVKSSVLIFLLRLFGQKDGVRRFVIVLNTINIAQMVAVFFAITLQCLPIQFNWDPTIPNGRCVDRRILFTFTSCFNIVTDLLVLGLPIWIFSGLKIPRRAKYGLLFVFLLGFFVTIASVVRLVIFVQGLFGLVTSEDPTFNIGFVASAIETNLALITASAPALRPIFRSRSAWFGRSSMAPSRTGPDLEAGQKATEGWPSDAAAAASPTTENDAAAAGISRKFGRGGSRSGKRGGRNNGGGGTSAAKKYDIRIRRSNTDLAELRSQSPRASEEETMTANGIMRISDIQREIDGIVKEIAVSGSGSYTGLERSLSRNKSTRGARTANTTKTTPPNNANISSFYHNTAAALGLRESNMNNFRNTGFDFFNGPRADIYTSSTRRNNPERYYSESVYPDAEYADGGARDYNEERISRYGEKRFGVVTPKSSKPPARPWMDESGGRPF